MKYHNIKGKYSVLPYHLSTHPGWVKLCLGWIKTFTIILKLCVLFVWISSKWAFRRLPRKVWVEHWNIANPNWELSEFSKGQFFKSSFINNLPAFNMLTTRSAVYSEDCLLFNTLYDHSHLSSLRPGDAYMHHWNGSSSVHVMACCLFGTKTLPDPMMTYCQLDP